MIFSSRLPKKLLFIQHLFMARLMPLLGGMRWADEIIVRTQPQREQEVMELLLETAALAFADEEYC